MWDQCLYICNTNAYSYTISWRRSHGVRANSERTASLCDHYGTMDSMVSGYVVFSHYVHTVIYLKSHREWLHVQ